MLRRSVEGLPPGPTVERIEVRDRLGFDQRGAPAPSNSRFFVVWSAGPEDGPPAPGPVRLRLARMTGETWHQDSEVPRQ